MIRPGVWVVVLALGVCSGAWATGPAGAKRPSQAPVPPAASCVRLPPEDVRLLVKARDAEGVLAALRCRRELLADETVRGALAFSFAKDAYESNLEFHAAMRRGGFRFVADLAPLVPTGLRDNVRTPLGLTLLDGNRPAVAWLLAEVRPGDLAAYRQLAIYAVDAISDNMTPPERAAPWRDTLLQARAKGLPTESGDGEAYVRALVLWWRTQDRIDYTDHSFGARSGPQPLPAALAPLWQEVAAALAPAEARGRGAAQLRAAEVYAKYHLDAIEARVEAFKETLAGATTRAGALVVDRMGVIDTQPGGRVSREAVESTIAKLQERAQRLRTTLTAQLGSTALPDWARGPGGAGRWGEFLGLRVGTPLRELGGGRPVPLCGVDPVETLCLRRADPPLAWRGDARVGRLVNAGGRFPPEGLREASPNAPTLAMADGLVRVDVPSAQRRPGLPSQVDLVIRGGRIEALLVQGGQLQLAGHLRREWGDPLSASTQWYRIQTGRFYNRAVGELTLSSGESAVLTERVYSGDDDRPIATYVWQAEGVTAEMICEMGCNLAITGARTMPEAPASVDDVLAKLAQEGAARLAYMERVLAQLPKPNVSPAAIPTCDGVSVAMSPDAIRGIPARDLAAIAPLGQDVGAEMALWARMHARFTGPDGCVHGETAARMWQSAMGRLETGRLLPEDVAAWINELRLAAKRVPRP